MLHLCKFTVGKVLHLGVPTTALYRMQPFGHPVVILLLGCVQVLDTKEDLDQTLSVLTAMSGLDDPEAAARRRCGMGGSEPLSSYVELTLAFTASSLEP